MKSIDRLISENPAEDIWDIISDEEGNEVSLIDKNEISAVLGPRGAVSERLPGYEARDSQIEMAWEVAEAFNKDRIVLVEAGTGVGKSMAYLVPSILWAVRNRERVVVSTNTINLQEQLTGKDIPFLRSVLHIDFNAVLVKGRGNYVCLRKARDMERETAALPEGWEDERREIIEWLRNTEDGSKSDLGFEPRKEVWEEFQSDPDTCIGRSCEYFSQCFFYRARREASSADILVVNHRLLFSDLSIKGKGENPGAAVLPSFSRLIIDEAHHLEDVATDHSSTSIRKEAVLKQLGRLIHRRDRDKGLLPFIASKLLRPGCRIDRVVAMIDHLTTSLEGCKHSVESTFDALYRFFSSQKGSEPEARITIDDGVRREERWDDVAGEAMNLMEKMRTLARGLKDLKGELSSEDDDGVDVELLPQILELGAVAERLESTSSSMENILFGESEDVVRWVEVGDGKTCLCLSPINAGGTLYETIFRNMRTVVLTSATLSVKGGFRFMRGRMGLDLAPEGMVTERLLPSTFNFKEQALLCIADDMPDPRDPGFPDALSDVIPDAIEAS
jgi:ATP-dependent DNA helicase DinG